MDSNDNMKKNISIFPNLPPLEYDIAVYTKRWTRLDKNHGVSYNGIVRERRKSHMVAVRSILHNNKRWVTDTRS